MAQITSHAGTDAKALFRLYVRCLPQPPNLATPSTVVLVDDEEVHVEVRECSANTINQVRAIRYIPLVVFSEGDWYVIPPHEVVWLVAQKGRGQHATLPFESATLNLGQIESWCKCASDQLNERVIAAIRSGNSPANAFVKQTMAGLQAQLDRLNEATKLSLERKFG